MNTLKCFLTSMMIVPGSFAHADPRADFSNCVEAHTKAAMAQRLPLAEFIETMKTACKAQELAFISAPAVASMADLLEVKEMNARQRKRSESYVSERLEANTITYSNWLASTAR
jgi:hypothetical protein